PFSLMSSFTLSHFLDIEPENAFLLRVKKFHVSRCDYPGPNKIYESRRSKTYLFEVAQSPKIDQNTLLTLHTNDHWMDTSFIKKYSTGRTINLKFQISLLISFFFSRQRVIPHNLQKKFFPLILKKLLERAQIIYS